MGYVSELRSLIGTRPQILVGSGVLCIDSKDRLLVIKHSDNGFWAIPGGMMELGETLEETARREVFEETGVLCHTIEFIKMFSGPQFYYCYPHGDQVFNVSGTYICRNFSGELHVDTESLEIGFFTHSTLFPNLLTRWTSLSSMNIEPRLLHP